MSVSTVTISIEEFEDLIDCKRKINKIKAIHERNIKDVKACNKHFEEYASIGDTEACKNAVEKQVIRNLLTLSEIGAVLKS